MTTVQGPQIDTVTAVAVVTDVNGSTEDSGSDSAIYDTSPQADLSIAKDDGKTSVIPGDTGHVYHYGMLRGSVASGSGSGDARRACCPAPQSGDREEEGRLGSLM